MNSSTNPNQIIETFSEGSLSLSEVVERYEIHEIIRRFGQWVVTGYGLESLVTKYEISKSRLVDKDLLLCRMGDKRWVILDEFKAAFKFAQEYHEMTPDIMPEILFPSDKEILKPLADHYTAIKLYNALLGVHKTYKTIDKYVPEDLPHPKGTFETVSVKGDFILSSAYSSFGYLLVAFLHLVNGLFIRQQFNNETLLNLSSRQFRHLLDQVLDRSYENKS